MRRKCNFSNEWFKEFLLGERSIDLLRLRRQKMKISNLMKNTWLPGKLNCQLIEKRYFFSLNFPMISFPFPTEGEINYRKTNSKSISLTICLLFEGRINLHRNDEGCLYSSFLSRNVNFGKSCINWSIWF